jgi:hypothetical protein
VSVSSRASHYRLVRGSEGVAPLASTRLVRGVRGVAALLLAVGLLLATGGCGTDAQTLRPYTPAEGINLDVGNPADPTKVVYVRNLLIISKAPGQGVLSATIVTYGRDELTGVTGTPIKVDGTEGAPFTATLTNTVSFANGAPIVLTDGSLIMVNSPDLAAGLAANVTLQFRNAGEAKAVVPVVDGNEPQYATISPAPTSTPST